MSTAANISVDLVDLKVHFGGRRGKPPIRAVDGVTLTIGRGETVGLIGESGSGKSTIGRAVIGLLSPTSGQVLMDGVDVWKLPRRDQQSYRSRIQVIFQDPSEALDPRMTVAASIAEPLRIRDGRKRDEHRRIVDDLLDKVGLDVSHGDRRPHQLSGGQKQRVNIARSLVLEPDLIVCDEVVSALDVSIQAEILNLFAKLQRERDLGYLFISHDLSVVAHVSHRVAVMYLGKLVEVGPTDQVIRKPRHPYTQALLAAQPQAVPSYRRIPRPTRLTGDIPSPAAPPSGCRFRTRCPYAQPRCADEVPEFREFDDGHRVACHYLDEIATGRLAPEPAVPSTTDLAALGQSHH